MAVVTFLFASILGIFGAILQLSLGMGGVLDAAVTYAMTAIGLPVVTLMAFYFRTTRDSSL